ncbi:MAG: DUF551 domain-containing protein, partial [Gammaproteobacteria bacterium]|nr:DUF551 domain-containing protein [Gammaproteobacteria bacterium]
MSEWISVDDMLPKSIPVLVYGKNEYKTGRTLRAMWIPKFSNTDIGDYDGDTDYSEELDEYFWPEGWYEWNECDDINY